jgi:WD40 repeat protein
VNGFRASHAVVIGINEYRNGIPQLRTAVNDARRIGQVLEADFGYSVQVLTEEVTLGRLRALFGESLPKQVEADDRLMVYFAGHGIALDGDDGPAGYIVPQDARADDRQTFLPMTDLNGWLNHLSCRHLLLVLDCCFAGAFRWSSTRELGDVPDVIHKERFDRYIRDPAWQVITSAAYDQKALDVLSGAAIGLRAPDSIEGNHSPFAASFLRALRGEADLYPRAAPDRAGGDGVMTATELYLYLRGCVEDEAEGDGHLQTPGLWPLKKHDKGEYIHLVPGHQVNLPPAPELDEANNPYRGLRSYDEEHASVYFGRNEFIKKLAERVASQPLTIVLGASGTGKSSVVKAGLLPHLRGNQPDAWQILLPMRPGKSPLASLASLAFSGEDVDIGTRLAEFWTDPEALASVVGAWAVGEPNRRLLIVVDQFEELLTLCWDAGERDQFLRLLDRTLAAHPDRIRIVFTLRSDFEPQFAQTPLQDEWMPSRIVVPAMTLDEYREVIEGPASIKVLYFQGKSSSQEFINRLIGDVANTPGALPLLSFTLSELYRRYLDRHGEDRALREDDYERIGGVGGSLRNRANEVFDKLSDDSFRRTMRNVMLRMISVEGGELARRHVPDDELVYDDPEENRRVEEVIRRLTAARLVVEGKESDDQSYIEPAHDELIRGWDRLTDWTRESLATLQLRQVLSPSVRDWCAEREFDPGKLWHANPRLALLAAELGLPFNWAKYVLWRLNKTDDNGAVDDHIPSTWMNRDERRFVTQSLTRKHRSTSIVAVIALSVGVVLLSLTLAAFHERNVAQIATILAKTETQIAEEKARLATSRQLAALSALERGKNMDLSALFAAEALNYEKTFEASDSLYKSVQYGPGINLLSVHEGRITSVGFSRNQKTIVAGYANDLGGGVVLWDVAARRRLTKDSLALKEGRVTSVALSPDGNIVAAGCAMERKDNLSTVFIGSGVILWDVVNRNRLTDEPLLVAEGKVDAVTFSSDGKTIAAGYSRGGIMLWDILTRKRLTGCPPPLREGNVMSLAFSPGGETLAAGYITTTVDTVVINSDVERGGIALWKIDKQEHAFVGLLPVKDGYFVGSVAFSPDGRTIMAGYSRPRGKFGGGGA